MIQKLFSSLFQGEPKTFVISDIHGCYEEFEALLAKLPLQKNSRLVFMGDYIDRGPDSAKVVQKIIDLSEEYETISLLGNHEKMFLDFLDDKASDEASLFVINGGTATLASYSHNKDGYHVPEEHMMFYRQLKHYHIDPEFVFVHAGVPDIPIEEFELHNSPSDFIWIRKTFFRSKFEWKKMIVHGHTPVADCHISPKRINIDTGCVFGNKLTALELPSYKTYEVKKLKPTAATYYTKEGSARKSERFNVDLPVMLQTQLAIIMCKAIDYSETGMLIMNDNADFPIEYENDDQVEGMIGIEDKDLLPFKGIVKRVQLNRKAQFFGIEFTESPFEVIEET